MTDNIGVDEKDFANFLIRESNMCVCGEHSNKTLSKINYRLFETKENKQNTIQIKKSSQHAT